MSVARLPGAAPLEPDPHPRLEVRAELRATLHEILDAAILVLQGTFGNIELYDPVPVCWKSSRSAGSAKSS